MNIDSTQSRFQSHTMEHIFGGRFSLLFILGIFILGTLNAIPAFADSQARIVRLSGLEGDIQMDRGTGQGFEAAILNLPITEGTRLRAGFDGFAEIEFEDNSMVRIMPGAVIEIPVLVLRDSGARATTVNVLDGTAYITYQGSGNDEFLLTFGNQRLPLTRSEHIRLEMGPSKARLSVLSGAAVQVEGPSETIKITKNHAVIFAMDGQDAPAPATAVTKTQYDAWEQRQADYHQRYSRNSAYRNPPYAFGMSDLNYYGSFINAPLCGFSWRPYFAGANWNPFLDGAWVWSPVGYTWVSSYPWGWMPYHYGSWQLCPNVGWAWQPGGHWAGWNNIPYPRGPVYPRRPVGPPRTIYPRRPPIIHSLVTPPGATHIRLRNDSAGLGIPRGSIDNLHKISRQVEQHGPVNAVVYTTPGGSHDVQIGMANGGTSSMGRQASGGQNASGNYSHSSSGQNSSGSYSHSSSGVGHSSSGVTHSAGSGSQGGAASRPASGGTTTSK